MSYRNQISDLQCFFFQEISAGDCGKSARCFKLPSTCTSSDNCDALVMVKYKPDESNIVDVTISTKNSNDYVSWAQSDRFDKMV